MTPLQFRRLLTRLGTNQYRVAPLLGVARRTVRRWAAGDAAIPPTALIILRLLAAGKITIEDLAVLGSNVPKLPIIEGGDN